MDRLIIPPSLRPGDTIAIVSPAGTVRERYVLEAAELLADLGYNVRIYPHALGKHFTYSGTADERYADLSEALLDSNVKAILCSRGGYGAVHLLDRLDALPLRDNAKWLMGYSDISALHALLGKHGIASIHSPMAKHISTFKGQDPDSLSLFSIIEGTMPRYEIAPNPLNRCGNASGTLAGGNLAVIADLLGTPYDVFRPGVILFIEDISEPVYKTERIMYQLRLSGVLERLGGLIVGQFTEYNPDISGLRMEEMIAGMVAGYSYPVAFGVPVGHVDHNIPLVEGAPTTLTVTPEGTVIDQRIGQSEDRSEDRSGE